MARDHVRADRGLRDEANVGPDPRRARRLVPMRDLDDYVVAEGEPDIRGWRVFTSSGRELGRIEDLLIDPEMNEVVMLDVDLRRNDRHTLAPIRAAWIDREHERVIIDSREIESAEEAVPTLARRGELTDDEVRSFGDRYDRAYGDRGYGGDDRDYDVRHLGDRLRFAQRRRIEAAAGEREAGRDAGGQSADAPPPSDEARRVNETLGADEAGDRAPSGSVERLRADEERADEERAAADRDAHDRERRQREVDAVDDARTPERRRDRQVRLPTSTGPADVGRGRAVEEVVRRDVSPEEPRE